MTNQNKPTRSRMIMSWQHWHHHKKMMLPMIYYVIISPLLLMMLFTSFTSFHKQQQRWYRQQQQPQVPQWLDGAHDAHHHSENDTNGSQRHHTVAGLSCKLHGGPYDPTDVDRMVYWRDVPGDASYPPYDADDQSEHRYLTFEPDEGGWNNIRMSLETAIAIAAYTGRILVLPPRMMFYLLTDDHHPENNTLSFDDFYHFASIQHEHHQTMRSNPAFRYVSFTDFLQQAVIERGILKDPVTNATSYPPHRWTDRWSSTNMKNYESTHGKYGKLLWNWLRTVSQPLYWRSDSCVGVFPAQFGNETEIQDIHNQFEQLKVQHRRNFTRWRRRVRRYDGDPTAVNDTFIHRLLELLSHRQHICVYNATYQNAPVLHLMGNEQSGYRMLQHYYTFLLSTNYHTDLWMKRFIRDHIRYSDPIQCAAARAVRSLHQYASQHEQGDDAMTITPNGTNHHDHNNTSSLLSLLFSSSYDAIHIRRGDFQYRDQRLSAEEIYEQNIRHMIAENRTVYIATDEKKDEFFAIFRQHYRVYFLHDVIPAIQSHPISPKFYGMIEQLICSRADVFVGTYFSTFTGYINRLRGYHAQKEYYQRTRQQQQHTDNNDATATHIDIGNNSNHGNHQGTIRSYYTVPEHMAFKRYVMNDQYHSIEAPFWSQEWHIGWRDIDYDVVEIEEKRTRT